MGERLLKDKDLWANENLDAFYPCRLLIKQRDLREGFDLDEFLSALGNIKGPRSQIQASFLHTNEDSVFFYKIHTT